jgi:hypothetical protein
MKNDSNIGIINEVGDLGLGFTPISKDDEKKIKDNTDKNVGKEK